MDTSEYGTPLSNLPPLAWLSGLNLGDVGLSGQQAPSLGADAGATQGGGIGMEGGLSLDALSELLQATQGQGISGNPADLFAGIGGTIGQGTLAQGGPGYSIAGGGTTQPQPQRQTGGYTAGQSQAGGIDPLQVLRQALGLAGKGVGIAQKLGQTEGYQTAGDTGQGAIDPTGFSLTQPDTGGFEQISRFFQGGLGGTSALSDPTLQLGLQGLLTGAGGTIPENILASLSADPALRDALFGGQIGGDLGETLSAPGGTAGFSLGGDTTLDTSLGGGVPGTNVLGAGQGGITGLLGLLNLYQGLQNESAPGAIGGGLQTVGGISSLLQSSPQLAQSLGITPGVLGGAGAAAGGLGGLLGLYSGIQSLQEGNALGGVTGIGGGALSTYGALQSLSAAYPALFGGQALPSLTGAIGGIFGGGGAAGAGAGAAGAGGAVAGGGAAGAGAGGAAAGAGASAAAAGIGGVLAAAIAPVLIASLVSGEGGLFMPADDPYVTFGGRLGKTLEGERGNIESLYQALPYVQSQSELGGLLDLFKSGIRTSGAGIGGFGEGTDQFTIPGLPGAGGSVHEWGQTADFGPQVTELQSVVNALRRVLPASGGPPASTLWNQLRTQQAGTKEPLNAPIYVPQDLPGMSIPGGEGGGYTHPGTPAGFHSKADLAASGALTGGGGFISYGEPGYDYAAAGLIPPGQAPAPQVSQYWQQLMQPRQQPQITPDMLQALLGQIPQQAQTQAGIGLTSSLQGQQPFVMDEPTRRMLFAQYGINA